MGEWGRGSSSKCLKQLYKISASYKRRIHWHPWWPYFSIGRIISSKGGQEEGVEEEGEGVGPWNFKTLKKDTFLLTYWKLGHLDKN